ncbi:universal stress protein [Corticimicrobacter populi]|uniref:Universal stress protein n=2 Tax=Corticimicrobacter populi TaxID=2175229 RepID=A0A2V1JZG1_9BURK|nr:universal stress protein [Corticimicrobacter populi]
MLANHNNDMKVTMKIVLLPYDGSEPAKRALEYLTNFAKEHSSFTVHILNVQPEPRMYGRGRTSILIDVLQQLRDDAREHAAEIAEEAAVQLRAAGLECTTHASVSPDTVHEVNRIIKENGCDTVVMGTRGMGGLGNLLLGSMATQVIHSVDIPVMLIK